MLYDGLLNVIKDYLLIPSLKNFLDLSFIDYECVNNIHEPDNLYYLNNINGPAYIQYYPDGTKSLDCWYKYSKKHRPNGPAEIWYENEIKRFEIWYENDKLHNLNAPAWIQYSVNGNKKIEQWYEYGFFIKVIKYDD